MFKYLKWFFTRNLHKIRSNVIYKTEDNLFFTYQDRAFNIVHNGYYYAISLSGIDNDVINVAKGIDPFKFILELDTESLVSLRGDYEGQEKYEVCEFIDKEIKRRV